MTDLFVIHDNDDPELGGYFSECAQDIMDAASKTKHFSSTIEVQGRQCNIAYVDIKIDSIKPKKFLFVAYSHGNLKSLTAGGEAYVEDSNCHKFDNTIFYTNACSSGIQLGPDLIAKKCLSYIGYNESVNALLGTFQTLSVTCDNTGIKSILEGHTIKQSFERMKDFYVETIDDLVDDAEFVRASLLYANKRALVMHCNDDNLTIKDIYNS